MDILAILTYLSTIHPAMGVGWLITVLVLPSGKEIWSLFKKWLDQRNKDYVKRSFENINKIYSTLQVLGSECKAGRVSILSAHNGGGKLDPMSPLKSTCLYEWVSRAEHAHREHIQFRPLTQTEIRTLSNLAVDKISHYSIDNIPSSMKDSLAAKGFTSILLAEISVSTSSYIWLAVEAKHSLDESKYRDLVRGCASTIRKLI